MRSIIFLLLFFIAISSFADARLFRYTHKASGDEMGICYSDKDGNPINNPEWNVIEIQEKDKQTYIDLQKSQQAAKPAIKSAIELRIEKLEADVTDLKAK